MSQTSNDCVWQCVSNDAAFSSSQRRISNSTVQNFVTVIYTMEPFLATFVEELQVPSPGSNNLRSIQKAMSYFFFFHTQSRATVDQAIDVRHGSHQKR